jgi:hypothetical protein
LVPQIRNARTRNFRALRILYALPLNRILLELVLEAYLRGCGPHRAELKKQSDMIKDFIRIANAIKTIEKTDRLDGLHKELDKLQFPKVSLPLNQR